VIRKVMAFAAAATLVAAVAFACDHDANKTSAAVASNGGSCSHSTQASNASTAAKVSTAGDHASCSMKSASASTGDHCSAASHASMASAGANCPYANKAMASNCIYGKNTVALNGECPNVSNVDFALAVKGARNAKQGLVVAQAIKDVPGVAAVTVDYRKQMAYVCADGSKCDAKSLVECLNKAGYTNARLADTGHKYCSMAHSKDKV